MANQTDEAKRMAIIQAYSGSRAWKDKVNRMSDAQVVAVYLRLQSQGKIK